MVSAKEYTITLNSGDLEVISAALIELPYRVSAPLINKISAQLSSSNEEAAPADERVTEDEQS